MELIAVSQTIIGQSAVNAVNSRELYEALGLAKGQYSRWAEKNIIEPYCLNEDYIGVRHDVEGNNITTFIVTIELAKHLAMMARTEKGKQIRDYFLECEKKAHSPQFQIPQTYSEALMLAAKQAEQIEQQTALIEAQKPKVEFYEAVTGSSDTIDIASVAKVLNIKGFGRNNLFEFLRDKNILMQNNQPFQTFVDRGYFRVIESKYNKPDGSSHINLKTVVYQKGLDYIRKLLELNNG